MKKIETKEDLPPTMKIFATQLQGSLSGEKETEFWEASSIDEFEKNASEIGYEIVPTLDKDTNRGYLIGFEVTESFIKNVSGNEYMQMKMYFIECSPEEFKQWLEKIKYHRELQQEDSYWRQEFAAEKRRSTKELK